MIQEEIQRVAEQLNLGIQTLNSSETEDLYKEVIMKFTGKSVYEYPLWENLTDTVSVQDPEGWKKISEYENKNAPVLVLEKSDGAMAFKFSDYKQVVELIGNCYGFVFYLTSEVQDFLICFNDHDYLIASGEAKKWLRSIY